MRLLAILLLMVNLWASAEELNTPQAAIEKYFDNFNDKNKQALIDAADSPFVFVIGGQVKTFDSYGDAVDFSGMEASGWAYSELHSNKLIYADESTAMVAVNFSRYNKSNEPIATSNVVYLLVQDSGRWKLKAGFVNDNLTLGKD
jgi:hypothetical protein